MIPKNTLSELAQKYLRGLQRDKKFGFIDHELIEQYMAQQHIPAFAPVVAFQQRYSGLKLSLFKSPGSTFYPTLFSQEHIRENIEIETVEIENKYYFFCGDHETAQFWFVLGEDGSFCTYNDDVVNPIHDTFEKFVEHYAYKDFQLRSGMQEYAGYFQLKNNVLPQSILAEGCIYQPASDAYHTWISYKNVLLEIGKFLDSGQQYVHIYGKQAAACTEVYHELKSLSVIA